MSRRIPAANVSQKTCLRHQGRYADDNTRSGRNEWVVKSLRAADAMIAKTITVKNAIDLTNIVSVSVGLGKAREMIEMMEIEL